MAQRVAARVGYVQAMAAACQDAGVANAVFFPSDYAGDEADSGLNLAYVGDQSWQGSDALVRAAHLRLESSRVLGANLQVRPLARSDLSVSARVYLWTSPARVNQGELAKLVTAAVLAYFDGATAGFAYQLDAVTGAILRASPLVQFVEFDQPTADAGVMTMLGGRLNFPGTLKRYFLRPQDVTLSFLPPL